MMHRTFGLLLLCLIATVNCQDNINFICNAQTTCRNCIQASPQCSWCSEINFPGTSRCYASSSNVVCNATDVQNPRGSVEDTSNEEFTEFNQISPLRVNITLRRGEPVSFPLRIKPARNFPLDLYLLMDLSYSMRDDLSNLKTLGTQIATAISGITTNFKLGFGAFVDKRVAPYVSIVPNTLIDPCGANCEGPYSFRHVISLVNDSDQFNQGIQDREISGNLDSPEGGFDGFIQSIVCQDLIGWRDNARHLLLYITDAGFHYAGDGKLGGAIIPNKGECLMPQLNGSFVDYQEYYRIDYPSIGQIRQRLREFDIIPLFASAQGARPFYDALAEELSSEGADVGTLADDSSNVVTLIQESYQRVSQRIIISPDNIPGLTFNVTPVVCPIIDGSECNGVQIEQEVQFNITASLLQCNTELTSSPTLVNFRVLGFGSFQVEVESLCSCECERNEEPNSPACTNGNGTLSCGTCLCNQGRFGEICQCGNNGLTSEGNSTRCSDGPNGLQCSGRGRCVCGQCDCEKFDDGREFFGVTCECDNFQCDRDPLNNLVCGGPNRGICSCNGQCNCLNSPLSGLQYTGSACDCSPDNNTCINPTNTQSECSNNGRCECGACICNQGYIGEFCQTCIDINACPVASCETNRLCAQCGTGVTTEGCEVCGSNVTMITDVGVEHTIEGNQATTCDFTDENGCEYRYFVALDPNGVPLPLEVDENVVCPIRVEPWIIAIIVIAALLILGILILAAIKIILMLLDYVEVKKFMKDVQNPEFRKNENPLYLKAEKDYPNPTYGK